MKCETVIVDGVKYNKGDEPKSEGPKEGTKAWLQAELTAANVVFDENLSKAELEVLFKTEITDKA